MQAFGPRLILTKERKKGINKKEKDQIDAKYLCFEEVNNIKNHEYNTVPPMDSDSMAPPK